MKLTQKTYTGFNEGSASLLTEVETTYSPTSVAERFNEGSASLLTEAGKVALAAAYMPPLQ